MAYNTNSARESLTRPDAFGDPLKNDPNFYLSSPCTFQYNCIAFAMGMMDRWVDVASHPWHWWPPIKKGLTKDHLKDAFLYFGFEECGLDDSFENEYDKVALYEKNDKWTHAAKIVAEGIYHSKFGASFNGQHSRGNVLELKYGTVYLIMKRLKSEAYLTDVRKGEAPGEIHTTQKVNILGIENYLVLYKGKIYLEKTGLEVGLDHNGKLYIITP